MKNQKMIILAAVAIVVYMTWTGQWHIPIVTQLIDAVKGMAGA